MKNKGLALFELMLIVVVIYFIVRATSYNDRAQLVPLLIGVPTLALLVFQTAADNISALERFNPGRVRLTSVPKKAVAKEKKPQLSVGEVRRREATALGWVVGLGVALTIFGFYITLPIFLLGFLRFAAQLSWTKAAICAAITMALLYVAFLWFLGVSFYTGIFF